VLPYISIFITILLFSSIEVFSNILNGNIDPLFLAFIRFFFSGIILIAIDFKRFKSVTKWDWAQFLFLAFIGIFISFGAYHISITGISPAAGAVIFSMNPIFSSIFAAFILKERLHINKILGILIGFIGVYVVVFGFNKIDLSNIKFIFLMLVASIGFGIYIAASKPLVIFFTTDVIFVFGSIPYLFFIDSFVVTNTTKSLPVLLYLSLITTGLAYTLYFYGLKRVPIVVGTSMFYLKPILATIFVIIILGDIPALHFYFGVIIILTGMFLTLNNRVFDK